MKFKKIFKKISAIIEKVNKKMVIKGYKIRLRYIVNQEDSELQGGRRFFSKKGK